MQRRNVASDDKGSRELPLFREGAFEYARRRLEGEVVVETPRWSKRASILIFVLACLLAALMLASEIPITRTVPGVIVTDAPVVRVTARSGGFIGQVRHAEGAHVRAGDVVAIVTSAPSPRDEGQLSRSRLQRAVVETRLRSQLAQRERLAEQIALQRERVSSAESDLSAIEVLNERGFASSSAVRLRETTLLTASQGLQSLRGQLTGVEAETAALRLELLLLDEARRYALVAPIDGTIGAVTATAGSPVEAGQGVLTIVPANAHLELEIYIPADQFASVEPGQPVRVRVDSLPSRRFGVERGVVRSVSRTVISPSDVRDRFSLAAPAFLARVRLSQPQASLRPGMTASAQIIEDRASLLDIVMPHDSR